MSSNNRSEPWPQNIPRPSTDYEDARNSGVYRLSELMFGSLLAAYVLGFIGFAASAADVSDPGGSFFMAFKDQFKYLFISATFAYVTAGLYISYHSGILTMPHTPLARLRWDFLVALAQAVLFGLSMLRPSAFPLFLGLVLAAAVLRQYVEVNGLVGYLDRKVRQELAGELGNATREQEEEAAKVVRACLKKKDLPEPLHGWRPVGPAIILATVLLVAFGAILEILIEPQEARLREFKEPMLLLSSAVIFGFVWVSTNHLLSSRAKLLYNEAEKVEIDNASKLLFDQLKTALKSALTTK